eukprot:919606-Prymnesium_polylepis.1
MAGGCARLPGAVQGGRRHRRRPACGGVRGVSRAADAAGDARGAQATRGRRAPPALWLAVGGGRAQDSRRARRAGAGRTRIA